MGKKPLPDGRQLYSTALVAPGTADFPGLADFLERLKVKVEGRSDTLLSISCRRFFPPSPSVPFGSSSPIGSAAAGCRRPHTHGVALNVSAVSGSDQRLNSRIVADEKSPKAYSETT